MAQIVKLKIAYDGSNYYGWQQAEKYPTIQQFLKQALKKLLQQEIQVEAASRTDRGVHAEGQIVHFSTDTLPYDTKRFLYSLNCLLPKDIVALDLELAQPDFHATLSCYGKQYHYQLCNVPFQKPHKRFFSWHYPFSLDVSLMSQGAEYFLGVHDFKAFCNTRKNLVYETTEREIKLLEIIESPEGLLFIIRGRNFLYKMVRNIVGTLVYLGQGKLTLPQIQLLLKNKNRCEAGITAPAHGLTLMKIFYSEEDYNLPLFNLT